MTQSLMTSLSMMMPLSMMLRLLTRATVAVLLGLLAGCVASPPAPVAERQPQPTVLRPDPGPLPAAASAAASSAASAAAAQRSARNRAASEDPRPESYIVKRGDTLYSIALDNGVEYRELAEWNDLEDANRIRIGQSLRLRAPGSVAGAEGVQTRPILSSAAPEARALDEAPVVRPLPGASQSATPSAQSAAPPATPAAPAATPAAAPSAASNSLLRSGPLARKLPYSDQNLALLSKPEPAAVAPSSASAGPAVAPPVAPTSVPTPAPPAAQPAQQAVPAPAASGAQADADADDDNIDWAWPSNGKLLAGFSEPANKGIDLAGRIGDPVLAAAAGKVVYSGQGLRGYGKLVIIKHNKTFLSAYAHNSNILVKEGQSVTRGQRIAEIGNTDSDSAKLHFEIRRFGKPTDPIKFLPAR